VHGTINIKCSRGCQLFINYCLLFLYSCYNTYREYCESNRGYIMAVQYYFLVWDLALTTCKVFSNKIFFFPTIYCVISYPFIYSYIRKQDWMSHIKKTKFYFKPLCPSSIKIRLVVPQIKHSNEMYYADDLIRFHLKHCIQKDTKIYTLSRMRLKCDDTRAETRFRLSAKRTSPFKSAGGR